MSQHSVFGSNAHRPASDWLGQAAFGWPMDESDTDLNWQGVNAALARVDATDLINDYRRDIPRKKPVIASVIVSLLFHGALVAFIIALALDNWLAEEAPTARRFDITLRSVGPSAESGSDESETNASAERPTAIPFEERQTMAPLPVAVSVPKAISEEAAADETPEQSAETQIVTEDNAEDTDSARDGETVVTQSADFTLPASLSRQQQTLAMDASMQSALAAELEDFVDDIDTVLQQGEAVQQWRIGEQQFTVSVEEQPARNDTDLDRLLVRISGFVDGRAVSTTAQVKRLAFSNFGQLVDRWDPDVALFNDEIDGRFHSNTRIRVDAERRTEPRFHGEVTVASSVDMRGGRIQDIFRAGLVTRAETVPLPDAQAPIPFDSVGGWQEVFGQQTEAIAIERMQWIDSDADIVFYANGEFGWTPRGGVVEQRRGLDSNPFYIVASGDYDLAVRGTVNGSVVVYSPHRISITGDLRYASDPRVDENADDYLGLISGAYVEIAPPDVTGPGDLTVQAAIYAKRRFVVKRFRARNGGLLTVYGSLTAGSLSASEPRYGTLIRHDPRLENRRPAGFPMTNRYELDAWNASWTVEQSP